MCVKRAADVALLWTVDYRLSTLDCLQSTV
jgi:hypothetical protein